MISINPYELILQIVNFGILYFLLKKFLAKPLSEFLSNRANKIKRNIDQAEAAKQDANRLLDEQKETLKSAQVDAQSIRKKAEESASKELEAVVKKGQDITDQMVQQAKKDIELQVVSARKNLLGDMTQLTFKIVEKFVSSNLSKEEKQKSIDSLIDQVSVKK